MLKQRLKQVLPAPLWKTLSTVKRALLATGNGIHGAVQTTTVWIVMLPVRLLPVGCQAAVKERLNPVRKMDYNRAPLRMAVNSHWQHYRLRSASKEPETVKWIEDNLRPGDVFYDIGANVGAYSLVAHAVAGGKAKIYAFEPGFTTFAELCKNIALNAAGGSIVPLQLGLGEETRVADFTYSELSAGAAQHAWAGSNNRQKEKFSGTCTQATPCCRLDDLIPFLKLERPDIVKLDVDGPEYEVLAGARETLSAPRARSLLVELEDIHAARITDLLKGYGFAVDQVHRRGATWCNYIFRKT